MKITHYADLTWPEVAELPRGLPLAIPLGEEDYDLETVAASLGSRELGILPPVPYGFHRAGWLGELEVASGLMRRVLRGVARGLRGQGFREVFFVDGHRAAPRLGGKGLRFLEVPHGPGPTGAWPRDLEGTAVLITTGHVEQHGLHLPLDTDTRIVAAIAARLASAAAGRLICLPAWPYGVSTHTRQFPGTLDLGGRTFEDFFLAIVKRLVGRGARAVLFSNGHGGNHSFLVNIVKWAGERWPETFVATEWLHTTGPALERIRESEIGGMGHGGELETSLMLHLHPEAVRLQRAVRETNFIRTSEYYMDWVEGGRLIANPPWTDDTVTGIYGDPTVGTAEKGGRWLAAAVAEKVESIDQVLEQARRRRERRSAAGRR